MSKAPPEKLHEVFAGHQKTLHTYAASLTEYFAKMFGVAPESIQLSQGLNLSVESRARIAKRAAERQSRHRFEYNIVGLSIRIKSPESVIRNLRLGTASLPETFPNCTIHDLCHAIPDLVGIRIVTLSQRQRWNIIRAVTSLKDLRSRCDDEATIGINLLSPDSEIRQDGKAKGFWKVFNPTIGKTYFVPHALDLLSTLITEEAEQALSSQKQLGKVTQARKAYSEEASFLQISPVFKASGYSTVQRICEGNLSVKGGPPRDGEKFYFELQVRTLLEHAWSEPEHKLSYKSPLSEDTRAILRTLSGTLASADDTVQLLVDRWREEQDPSQGANLPFRSYTIKVEEAYADSAYDDIRRSLIRDFTRLDIHRKLGHFSDAIRVATACQDVYRNYPKLPDDFRLELLQSYLYFGNQERAKRTVDDLINKLADSLEQADESDPYISNQRFWFYFRRSHHNLQSLKQGFCLVEVASKVGEGHWTSKRVMPANRLLEMKRFIDQALEDILLAWRVYSENRVQVDAWVETKGLQEDIFCEMAAMYRRQAEVVFARKLASNDLALGSDEVRACIRKALESLRRAADDPTKDPQEAWTPRISNSYIFACWSAVNLVGEFADLHDGDVIASELVGSIRGLGVNFPETLDYVLGLSEEIRDETIRAWRLLDVKIADTLAIIGIWAEQSEWFRDEILLRSGKEFNSARSRKNVNRLLEILLGKLYEFGASGEYPLEPDFRKRLEHDYRKRHDDRDFLY